MSISERRYRQTKKRGLLSPRNSLLSVEEALKGQAVGGALCGVGGTSYR